MVQTMIEPRVREAPMRDSVQRIAAVRGRAISDARVHRADEDQHAKACAADEFAGQQPTACGSDFSA